jgi:hypothetical protein
MAEDLSLALSVLACDPCLSVGQPLLKVCKPIHLTCTDAPDSDNDHATWLCAPRLFFTLIKHAQDTLLYSHSNQMLYFASAQAQLSPSTPDGTAFLCQFAMDRAQDQLEPRLLAFDLVSTVPDPSGRQDSSPSARGAHLRSLTQHLPKPLCCVQWVGQPQCLTQPFRSALPHSSSGTLFLQPSAGDLNAIFHTTP